MWKNTHINLWKISKNILHKIINIFDKNKNIKISQRIFEKIKAKHPECLAFIQKEKFQILIKNSFSYFKKWKSYNFFCKTKEDDIILIWLQKQQNHISIHTIFKINETKYWKYDEKYKIINL